MARAGQADGVGGQLGAQLRQLMKDSGRSNYELAERSGVAEEVLRRFTKGERDLRLETASKIAAELGIRPLEVAKRRAGAK